MVEVPKFSGEISMERNRDLRDYALVNGFSHARDYVSHLQTQLEPGDTFLDIGCGAGKAISQAARRLNPLGINCVAVDTTLPERQFGFVDYLKNDFAQLDLPNNSVKRAVSVCGLFMYAENSQMLLRHAREIRRILTEDGELSVVVQPVISAAHYEAKMAKFRAEITKRPPKTPLTREQVDELLAITADRRMEVGLLQRVATEMRLQSPSERMNHFRANIAHVMDASGLYIKQRLIPRGGRMIDEEITLIIGKSSRSRNYL